MTTVEYVEFKTEPLFRPRWLSSVLLFLFTVLLCYLVFIGFTNLLGWKVTNSVYVLLVFFFANGAIRDYYGFVRIQNHEMIRIFSIGYIGIKSVPIREIKELQFKHGRRLFVPEKRIKIITERQSYLIGIADTEAFVSMLLSINKDIIVKRKPCQ